MVFPEFKIKEKRKSFNLRMKISKNDVEGIVLGPEDVTELKREILEELSYQVDDLINLMVEDEELSEFQEIELENSLNKVTVFVDEDSDEDIDDIDEYVTAGGDLDPAEESPESTDTSTESQD